MEDFKNFRILLLDTKRENPNHYICLALFQALTSSPYVKVVIKAELHNAIVEANKNKCNLFIAFDGEQLNRLICKKLSEICGLSVMWVTEDPYEISINVRNSDLFDIIFTNDSGSVNAYGKKGRHLALAAAKNIHCLPILNENKLRYDYFFAGTAWPNRVELIKDLLAENKGLAPPFRSKIALPTNKHLPAFSLELPKSEFNWRIAPTDFAKYANMSCTTLVLPRIFSASGGGDFAETPPPRLFEAALAGTVQLVQRNIVEAVEYFENEVDFFYFEDIKELRELIIEFSKNSILRFDIARNAQKKALSYHCYENRVATIFEELLSFPEFQKKNNFELNVAPNKPRVLSVLHNVVNFGKFGGVEVYAQALEKTLCGDFDFYYYVPSNENPNTVSLLNGSGEKISQNYFSIPNSQMRWSLTCKEREEAFSKTLIENNISVVHFHHLIGHVPSLVAIAKAIGVKTVFTVHDYYAICDNFMLLSFKGRYCRPDNISTMDCDVCLSQLHNIKQGSQSARRVFWDGLISNADELVFNTKGSEDLLSAIYPSVELHKKKHILPVPIELTGEGRRIAKKGLNLPLKVAILGNFIPHKGSDLIARVIGFFANNPKVEFHIFGDVDPISYVDLKNPELFPYVHIYGGYTPNAIPLELNFCHTSLHVSLWPETYSLTLSEAWEYGLIPIVSDIGALGERVISGQNGIKIDVDSDGQLIEAILKLMQSPNLLREIQKNIENINLTTYQEHGESIKKIYKVKNLSKFNENTEPFNLELIDGIMYKNWAQFNVTGYVNNDVGPANLLKKLVLYYQANGLLPTLIDIRRFVIKRIVK